MDIVSQQQEVLARLRRARNVMQKLMPYVPDDRKEKWQFEIEFVEDAILDEKNKETPPNSDWVEQMELTLFMSIDMINAVEDSLTDEQLENLMEEIA
jgi:hypothetical protein